ncbi:caspase domain-containing protein [Trametes meyenii]|nr:caspase domain-containing protein [Trametes meyenii]
MMWDFSRSSSGGQGSPPYYAQQHSRGISPAPPYVHSPPAGFDTYASGPPPAPFMPIGAPGSGMKFLHDNKTWCRPWMAPGASSAPAPRSPIAIHIQAHYTSHHSHSHTRRHSHSHGQSHSHSARPPSGQHGSSSPKISSAQHRPKPDRVQSLQPTSHDHHFMYSKCTGRKKALCIGINYRGQPNELHGCVNDAKNVTNFLMRRGYKEEDIVILTDDAKSSRQRPTRTNIIDAMHWLVKGAHTHDSLFFHYSGHGGQIKDKDGDEIDGYDEIIFPLDYKSAGYITDDDMHAIMVKKLPTGCRLTALFDSCHSGSILDLPYLYSSDGRVKGSQVTDRWVEYKSTPADVISWSGCKDSQTSADTWEQGVATGAMSYAFMTSLHQNPNQTYQELLRSIRVILRKRYSQKPQLSSSHRIDTNLRFII